MRFLPQDDRLLRHVEVVLAQLILVQNHHHHDNTMLIIIVILSCMVFNKTRSYLHDDRDPGRQGLGLEHVELAGFPLSVKDAGNEDCEEQHGDYDQAWHYKGKQVFLVR